MPGKAADIKQAFGGRLIGKKPVKNIICNLVALLPDDFIGYITAKIWFVSSPLDAWAFALKGSDIYGQNMIFLSDELFKQDRKQIQYTIMHEIGHLLLGHKNSIGFRQSVPEIDLQEKEADIFAKKYLNITELN